MPEEQNEPTATERQLQEFEEALLRADATVARPTVLEQVAPLPQMYAPSVATPDMWGNLPTIAPEDKPLPAQAVGVRLDGTPIMPGDPDNNDEAMKAKKAKEEKPKFNLTNSEFRVVTDIMSMRQLLDSRRSGIRERRCVINGNYNENYYLDVDMNTTASIAKAKVFTVHDVLAERLTHSSSWHYALLDEEQLAKEPPQRKMTLESHINATLVQLMKVAPQNEIVRGHLMAIFGRLPPEELTTFEQLKDWVEFGFYPPRFDSNRARIYGLSGHTMNMPEEDGRRPAGAIQTALFSLACTTRDVEVGDCEYRVNRRAQFQFAFTRQMVRDIVGNHDNLHDMLEECENMITEHGQNSVTLEDNGEHEYLNHESRDWEDSSVEIDMAELKRQLTRYIEQNYGPEEISQILGE